MWEFLALTVLSIFAVGCVTLVWLVFRMVCAFLGADPIAKRKTPPKPPPSIAIEEVKQADLTVEESRLNDLRIFQREALNAYFAGHLSYNTKNEIQAYLKKERETLKTAEMAKARAQETTTAGQPVLAPLVQSEDAAVPEAKTSASKASSTTESGNDPKKQPESSARMRDPAEIRRAIQKLHEDAQAPVEPEPEKKPKQRVEVVPLELQTASVASNSSSLAAGSAVNVDQKPEAIEDPKKVPPKRTLAERLFTAEHVRILQSLGIGIIFISAVAFVRTQMWDGASAWGRMGMLLAGTAVCSAAGFALRRWTSLKITGLGLLVLGHLSLLLDAYAMLVSPGDGGAAIYPYTPASLWIGAFSLFTISAAFQARALKEPLMDAFTWFGALATWGATMRWTGVDWALMPAAFVPLLILVRFLAGQVEFRLPRVDASTESDAAIGVARKWSLSWWMVGGWQVGAVGLVAALPTAAWFFCDPANSAHVAWHTAAITLLAIGMFAEATRERFPSFAHFGAALLLFLAFFHAHVADFSWPLWPVAISVPGFVFVLVSLLLAPRKDSHGDWRQRIGDALSDWGMFTVWGAAAGALFVRWCFGDGSVEGAWCAGLGMATGLTFTLLRQSRLGVYLFASAGALFVAMLGEYWEITAGWWSSGWFLLAMAMVWAGARNPEDTEACRVDATICSHILALLAGIWTYAYAPFIPWECPGNATLAGCMGWGMIPAYLIVASRCYRESFVLGLGVAFLSPAIVYAMYANGMLLPEPAPWLGLAAVVVMLALKGLSKITAVRPRTVLDCAVGSGALVAHGTFLAIFQSLSAQHSPAAISFAVLAGAIAVLSSMVAHHSTDDAPARGQFTEALAMGWLAAAGANVLASLGVRGETWPIALQLLASVMLLASMLAEMLANRIDQMTAGSWRRYALGGEYTALALSWIGGLILLPMLLLDGAGSAVLCIHTWSSAALVGLFIAFRAAFTVSRADPVAVKKSLASNVAGAVSGVFILAAAASTLVCGFWMPACAPVVRFTCAVFFLAIVGLSAAAAVFRKSLWAPPSVMLALLGLLGCAYGAWKLPPEHWGVCCALLATLSHMICGRLTRHDAYANSPLPTGVEFSTGIASMAAATHLIYGLVTWPVGSVHVAATLAWVILAGLTWTISGRREGLLGSTWSALAAGIATGFVGCHTLRWAGWEYVQFGPGLVGLALMLLCLRVAVRGPGKKPEHPDPAVWSRILGLSIAISAIGVSGFVIGFVGWLHGHEWLWVATLLECAVALGVGAVAMRSEQAKRVARAIISELMAWLLLVAAIAIGLNTSGLVASLSGATWALVGAILVALGMALESVAGAYLGRDRHELTPTAFLESRYLTAMSLCALAVFTALVPQGGGHELWIDTLWRGLLCASALSLLGSLSRWSYNEKWTSRARKTCAFVTYVALLPLGYLAFLASCSTGSSWGGAWFMLLTPVLLAASYILEKEKEGDQSELAQLGAVGVCVGSLILAFLKNTENLAAVPATVFALLSVMAVWWRVWRGRVGGAVLACMGVTGTAFYGMRAGLGLPAWMPGESWVWEMPIMAAFGLGMLLLGGAFKLEIDRKGRSLVGMIGAWVGAAATASCAYMLLWYGPGAEYIGHANQAHLDAMIASLLVFAGVGLAARYYLVFSLGSAVSALATLAAYFLVIWKFQGEAWEFYTLPSAVFLFIWAWRLYRERREVWGLRSSETIVNRLVFCGSATASLPSLFQAIPNDIIGLWHFLALLIIGLGLVLGAMWARRKIPLIFGSGVMVAGTLIKAVQWAAEREVMMPVLGIVFGFVVLALGSFFETHMNRAIREAVDRARAEAKLFWVTWR